MNQNFQTIRDQIINKLQADLKPVQLDVIDDSHKHVGHAGHNGQGESHFRINIISAQFENQTRIACHQMVYKSLENLIPPIHALQISTKTPK